MAETSNVCMNREVWEAPDSSTCFASTLHPYDVSCLLLKEVRACLVYVEPVIFSKCVTQGSMWLKGTQIIGDIGHVQKTYSRVFEIQRVQIYRGCSGQEMFSWKGRNLAIPGRKI